MNKHCIFCEEDHLDIIREQRSLILKGVTVEYTGEYLYCPVEDEQFQSGDILDKNLKTIREAFKGVTGVEFINYIKK